MRSRARKYLPVAAGILSLVSLLLLKAHLYVLGQVFYTYASFSTQHHGILDVRFDGTSIVDSNLNATPVVPNIIHQIWLDESDATIAATHIVSSFSSTGVVSRRSNASAESLPPRYAAAHESCVAFHPDWHFKLWTSEAATAFVSEEYPSILPHYQSYCQTIQRTNILRYLVLHHFGGVYLDLDISCRHSLERLRSVPWLTPAAYPAGINNAFIMSKQSHPFLTSLIGRIESHNLWWPTPYIENMLSTGCMFISMEYARFGGLHKKQAGLRILGLDGKFEPHMLRGHVVTPLFEHAGESSWHRWDGRIMLLVGRHWQVLLVVLVLTLSIATATCVCTLLRRSPHLGPAKGSDC